MPKHKNNSHTQAESVYTSFLVQYSLLKQRQTILELEGNDTSAVKNMITAVERAFFEAEGTLAEFNREAKGRSSANAPPDQKALHKQAKKRPAAARERQLSETVRKRLRFDA